jgi:hypothetical protein
VSSEDRVLFVGEAAVFDADFPHVYNTVFDDSLFEKWFGEPSSGASDEKPSRPADEIQATLAQQGVTHVLVNWLEVIRYRQPGSYGFTDFVHPSRFDELVADGVLRRTRFTMPVPWEKLSDSQRQEIERWAPGLRGAQGVSAIELYEVVAPTKGSP